MARSVVAVAERKVFSCYGKAGEVVRGALSFDVRIKEVKALFILRILLQQK